MNNVLTMLSQLRSNPMQILSQKYNVPQGMTNLLRSKGGYRNE